MPVGDLMSARNAVRYSLIITVFAGFPEYFGKYIQVIGVLCGYNKFDYVDQYDKQTFVLIPAISINENQSLIAINIINNNQ